MMYGIFMKVMRDMWDEIEGYKIPENEIKGFLELNLTMEGYGVCRNMAIDIAKKLNAINPEYNARTLIVETEGEGTFKKANIERKFINEDGTVEEEYGSIELQAKDESNKGNIIYGNHVVTVVDVKKDNLMIVLDPTNPSLGVYKNGKIENLNSDERGEAYCEPRGIDQWGNSNNYDEGFQVFEDYIKSFDKSNLTDEEIKEKYGWVAQDLSIEDQIASENEQAFKNVIKVSKEKLNNNKKEHKTSENKEETKER